TLSPMPFYLQTHFTEPAGKAKNGRLIDQSAVLRKNQDYYFFSSFLGLHFSQVLPSFLAVTQHSCLHSSPLALAFSQQVCFFSAAKEEPASRANAQAITV